MKLLFFVQMVDPEDTIRGFIVEWIRALSRDVDELIVLSQETRLFNIEPNVRIITLGKEQGFGKWRQSVELVKALNTFVGGRRVDAVLTHMTPKYTSFCWPFCAMASVPLFTWYTHSHVSLALRLADLFSTACFTASSGSYRIESDRKKVVGHGIPTSLFSVSRPSLSETEGPLRFNTASRLSPVKRLDVLLGAFEKLSHDNELNWTLDLAGDAPMDSQKEHANHLMKMAKAMGDRVRMHGAVPYPRMPAFLSQGDVYVNLSGTDSIDKGCLEALLAGQTVVTANKAFRSFLEGTLERTYLETVDSQSVCQRLKELCLTDRSQLQADRDLLVQRVIEQHSLENLSVKLINEMAAYS